MFSNQEIVDFMEPSLKKRRDDLDKLRNIYAKLEEALNCEGLEVDTSGLEWLRLRISILEKDIMKDEAYVEGLKASL